MPRKPRKGHGLKLHPPGTLRKGPNWIIRGTYRGVTLYRSTGSHRKPPEGYIRSIEREIDEQLDRGPIADIPTFADAVREYVKDCPVNEIRFIEPLLDHFQMMPLREIDSGALWKAAISLYPDAKPQTRNRQVLSVAGSILHHAHDLGMCEYIRIKRFKAEKPRTTYASPAVAMSIINALPDSRTLEAPRIKGLRKGPGRLCHPRACAVFCFLSGRRMGDAMGLTWEKVDLNRRTITIDRTKNGDPITVPMHDDVFFELANLPHRQGRVFGFGNRRQFLDDWHKACDSLGIERRRDAGGLTPHGMRHSFATWLRQQGKGLREIMQAGGWQNEKAAMRYLHVDSQETIEAVTNLPSLRAKTVHSDAKEG